MLVDVCTALLEETLPLRRTMLDLSTECGDLADMLLGVGAPQLTCLCRALMVVVYESDPQSEEDKEDDALAGSRHGGPRFCDANHGALLAVPGLIARLVRVLRLRTLPPFMFTADQQQHWRLVTYLMRVLPQGADTVLPRLMTLLTASPQRTWEDVNLQAATLQPGERLDAVSRFQLNGEPEPVGRGMNMDEAGDEEGHPDYMQRPAHHGDVLFLLCTLMQGAHKTAAQEAVTAAGFPAVASLLYDAIDWQSPDHDPGAPAGGLHGPNCTCSARSALRIQYLRCVHAFIERDGNCAAGEDSSRAQKLSLLSPEEIAHFYPEHAPQAATAGSSQRGGDAGKKQASSSRPRGVVAAARQRLSQCMHMTRSVSRAAGPGLVSDPAAALVFASPVPAVPVNLPPGLMTKLVRQYMTAPHDVSHRFWLASCADAFVRGAVHSDQRLVAHTGLLLHLLRDILHHDGSRPTGSLQSCCDILAEMVKGNSGLWDELQGLLHDMGDPACERLAAIVMAHLVDSNMLIRSGILSMNALRTVDGDAAAPGGEREEEGEGDVDMTDAAEQPLRCEEPSRLARAATAAASEAAGHESADAMPLCVWLGFGSCPRNIWFEWLNANWLDILAALVDAVPPAELDSECVCTTNTALVMLLLARRAGCLAACLGALAQHPRQPGDPRPPPCVGFHATLRVWAKSYLAPWPARDRDRRSLEHATGFDFVEFRDLATVLLSDNTDSPVALLHYA